MRRITIAPRDDWRRLVEAQGFLFHSADDAPYWDEGAYYAFHASEVDLIERATYRLEDAQRITQNTSRFVPHLFER